MSWDLAWPLGAALLGIAAGFGLRRLQAPGPPEDGRAEDDRRRRRLDLPNRPRPS